MNGMLTFNFMLAIDVGCMLQPTKERSIRAISQWKLHFQVTFAVSIFD